MEILINEKNYRVLVFDATFNNISAISGPFWISDQHKN
jgi:hypothetical protein